MTTTRKKKTNDDAATKTVHWKSEYEGMTWEKRKSKFEQADVIIIGIVASTDIEAMLPDVSQSPPTVLLLHSSSSSCADDPSARRSLT